MAFNVPKVPTIFDVPIFDEKNFELQYDASDFAIDENNIISITGAGNSAHDYSGTAQSTTSTSYQDYTHANVTLTTSGKSVFVTINCSVVNDTAEKGVNIRISRDNATATSGALNRIQNDTGVPGYSGLSMSWIDTPAAGSHTYEIQFRQPGAGGEAFMFGAITAFELI